MRRTNRNSDYQKNDRKRILRILQLEAQQREMMKIMGLNDKRNYKESLKRDSEYVEFEEVK